MTKIRLIGRVAAAAMSLGALPMAFAQAPMTQACAGVGGLNGNQPLCAVDSIVPTTLAGTQLGVGDVALASGSAAALAQFGTLKASTSATELLFLSQGASSSGSATALALVRDTLTISSPGLDGQPGFVDFRIDYAWRFSNDAFSSEGQFNTADVTLEFGGGAAYARRQHGPGSLPGTVESILVPIGVNGADVTALDAQLGRFFTVRMPFIFGVEYDFHQSLALASGASFGATASIDAFNSAYWGGMVVRTENLGLVSFAAESDSGLDYTRSYAPVPEPGAGLLAVFGLMALGAHRLMRQERPRVG